MKHVVKSASPAQFDAWKSSGNASWQPAYSNLQNPQKKVLHQALLDEQGRVCCYCGRSISLENSHIEHFRPQETHPHLALDFDNLYASCIRETKPGAPLHCGHAKGRDFDAARHISPQDPQCERRFVYTLGGAILAADAADAAADYMRDLLKLDIAFVRARREAVLASVFDSGFLETVTDSELQRLAHAFRTPDADGALDDFGHVLARFAGQLAGKPL